MIEEPKTISAPAFPPHIVNLLIAIQSAKDDGATGTWKALVERLRVEWAEHQKTLNQN